MHFSDFLKEICIIYYIIYDITFFPFGTQSPSMIHYKVLTKSSQKAIFHFSMIRICYFTFQSLQNNLLKIILIKFLQMSNSPVHFKIIESSAYGYTEILWICTSKYPWFCCLQSQILARLAAAHRGAVRAIQSFVNSLPFTDLQRGLPASYQELALLIRQMSLLSTQLNTEDKSSVHQDLLSMLDKVDVSSEV